MGAIGEAGLVEEARDRRTRPITGRELTFGATRALLVVGAAVLLAGASPPPAVLPALALFLAYAVVWRIEVEIGALILTPNALVLVPMLAVVGPGWTPALAVAAAVASEYRTRGVRQVIGTIGSSAATIVAALVLLAFGTEGFAWAPYVVAIAVYIVADHANGFAHVRLGVGAHDARPWPGAITLAVEVGFAGVGCVAAAASADAPYAWVAAFPIALVAWFIGRERRERIDSALELSHAYRGTAQVLGQVIDADDGYTGYHSRGVVELAVAVAEDLGLGPRDVQLTEFAAMLHDVGKIRVPKEIINKPGPLTPDEWEVVRRHPGDGADMLAGVGGFLAEVGEIVRHHHERWDGNGYPSRLAAEEIPLIARIVAACDAFSAMTTDRAYRRGRPVAEAVEELRRSAGTQFDPAVITAVCHVLERDDVRRAMQAA